MGWYRVSLSEEQQQVVTQEQKSHPQEHVRRKMHVLWLLHCGLTREKAAEVAQVSRATVFRYVAAFRDGGLDALRRFGHPGPVSDLATFEQQIRECFEKEPVATTAEACDRIEQLTGIRREPTQVRKYLKSLKMKWLRVRAVPCPPKKSLEEHVKIQGAFLEKELEPLLKKAREGNGHVFFVDAAHFVFGTFLCCLWCFHRIFVRAASGRQRFNVLGAWNAVSNTLTAVTNTTVVNTQTMIELLNKIAEQKLVGSVTIVLDNAKYQRNAKVQAAAKALNIELLFLPSYSPNLNLIERLWRFIKKRTLYGKYYHGFAGFKDAIERTIQELPTKHEAGLSTMMTHHFQTLEKVSLLAA